MIPTVHVTLAGREHHFQVSADALSILDAGLDAGVPLPYSCCAGICTSCCAKVISGAVSDAEQAPLEPSERAAGFILCCQVLPTSAELRLNFDEHLPASG